MQSLPETQDTLRGSHVNEYILQIAKVALPGIFRENGRRSAPHVINAVLIASQRSFFRAEIVQSNSPEVLNSINDLLEKTRLSAGYMFGCGGRI